MSESTQTAHKLDPKILEANIIKLQQYTEFINKGYEEVRMKWDKVKRKAKKNNVEMHTGGVLAILNRLCKEALTNMHTILDSISNTNESTREEISACLNTESGTNNHVDVRKSNNKDNGESSKISINNNIAESPATDEANIEGSSDVNVNNSTNGILPVCEMNKETSVNDAGKENSKSSEEEKLDVDKDTQVEEPNVQKEDDVNVKGKIRLVAIEKLLDPKIASSSKHIKALSSNNVIVIDSDEENNENVNGNVCGSNICKNKEVTAGQDKTQNSNNNKTINKGQIESKIEKEREKQKERVKERKKASEIENEKEEEKERKRASEIKKEKEREKERIKTSEIEKEKEREKERKKASERENEKKRASEIEKEKEREKERKKASEREKEKKSASEIEKEKEREKERKKTSEIENEKEEEKERIKTSEIEKEKERVKDKRKVSEVEEEKETEKDKKKALDIEKEKETEKEKKKTSETEKDKEREKSKRKASEIEKENEREKERRKASEREKEREREKDKRKASEIEEEKERKKYKERALEKEKRREKEKMKEKVSDKVKEAEGANQNERLAESGVEQEREKETKLLKEEEIKKEKGNEERNKIKGQGVEDGKQETRQFKIKIRRNQKIEQLIQKGKTKVRLSHILLRVYRKQLKRKISSERKLPKRRMSTVCSDSIQDMAEQDTMNRKRKLKKKRSEEEHEKMSTNGSKCGSSSEDENSTNLAAKQNTKDTFSKESKSSEQKNFGESSTKDKSEDQDSDVSTDDFGKSTSISKKKKENEKESDNESDSSSDSGILRRKAQKKIRPSRASSSDSFSLKMSDESSGSDMKKKKKRKRIRTSNDSDSSNSEKGNSSKKRKNIRKVMKTSDLRAVTKEATKEEEQRRKRVLERQILYNQIYKKPESVELDELVLDFDKETQEKLLEVDSSLLKKLKPHQATGIKFMWDACFETLKDTREKPGSGCILAHCMGLGKTLQIVTLTHTLLANSRKTHIERVLIITPLSTLNNWAREYLYWMKFCKKKDIEVYDMSRWREKQIRVRKINEWFEEGGVCILGYDMYRILSNPKTTKVRKQRETLQKCLVDPGPDLVVCDEGHLLKNEKTSISQAVNKMRTKRRIVLTGTPLQNNLREYYCMIQFIKPNLLGTYKEYLNRFVNPITNGQYTDSTARDIQLMKHRSHVLHKLLEGCIQRKDYSVLAPYLPPKHEYVVFITLSDIQKKLYKDYMTTQRNLSDLATTRKGAALFQDFQHLRRIWTHPMSLRINSDFVRKKMTKYSSDSEGSLRDFVVDEEESTDSDSSDSSSKSSDESGAPRKATPKGRKTRGNPDAEDDSEIEMIDAEKKDEPSEWWKSICSEEDLNNINHSPKLMLLMDILECCENIGDKILLFSQSLQSLDVIEHFLALIDKKTQGDKIEGDVNTFTGSWTPGVDYFRLDGSCSVEQRENMCKTFNNVNNLRARLFLISTRAGSLGINLVAANRVIIFDVSWNPSHDTQSIFRVYRFGQEKPCYIYRFVAMGTMEQKLYERQVTKQATSKRVLDEQQIGRHYNQSDLLELYSYELECSTPREVPILPKDRLFADLLTKHEKLIYQYHEHDSLLENEENENLTEEERKAAWAAYEAEREAPVNQYVAYNRPFGAKPNGPVTSNKIFGIRDDILLQLLNLKVRRDHPALNDNEIIQMVPSYLNQLYAEVHSGNRTLYSELLEINGLLQMPHNYLMSQMGTPYMTTAPTMGINPFAYAAEQQNHVGNPTTHGNPSQVYEID